MTVPPGPAVAKRVHDIEFGYTLMITRIVPGAGGEP